MRITNGLRAALDAVIEERERQNAKWGEQNHDPMTWLPILMEEVGEAAQEAVKAHFTDEATPYRMRPHLAAYRAEMVQVAAVAVAMIECLDRAVWKEGQG